MTHRRSLWIVALVILLCSGAGVVFERAQKVAQLRDRVGLDKYEIGLAAEEMHRKEGVWPRTTRELMVRGYLPEDVVDPSGHEYSIENFDGGILVRTSVRP